MVAVGVLAVYVTTVEGGGGGEEEGVARAPQPVPSAAAAPAIAHTRTRRLTRRTLLGGGIGSRAMGRRRRVWSRPRTVGLAAALALVPAGVALGDFPQSAPNDPDYAPAEASPAACATASVNDDQHGLFSFMPRCAPAAKDPESSSGDFTDQAWKQFSAGRGDVTVAYIDGGLNWHLDDARELADKVYLNPGELPAPTTPSTGAAQCPDPRVLCAADYSDTPDYNHNGYVDPEDIIKRFSDGRDNDHNGYVDDISGWDFYDRQNDPATIDASYAHANDQQRRAGAQTNNGFLGAGVCPRCMIMPIKAGAEALDRDTELAQAWLYAADHGASVIVSVTADLGYTSFMRQVVKQLWARGVVLVQASNDFDSLDHQGGMFWPHVLPGNGLVSNTESAKHTPADNLQTTSYRERSDYSSWGTHNMFSVATQGGTTSEDTPTVGGSMALVLSWGRDAAARGLIAKPLTGPEAVQVVRATASPVDDPSLNWPGKPGFNLQYGYGRPNLLKADQAVAANHIPPVAWLDRPEWYSVYDPTTTSSVPIAGHVEAPRSSSYSWALQYAPGPEPADSDWHTISSGSGSAPRDGTLGTLDLKSIPPSFYEKRFALSQTKEYETNDQYTVTLRLQVTDASGQVGEERRAIAVHHDPTLLPGFPRAIGDHGGEAQAALADVQGTGREAIVFGDSDGNVHAIDPRGARELPGWPVQTDPVSVTLPHAGIDPGHEPVVSSVAVGDLDHDGRQWVVATSLSGRTYVFDSRGHRRAGWPKALATGVVQPGIPRVSTPFTRVPVQGATAPPVLFDLEGRGQLDVIQGAWDGHVYAWRPDGTSVPGWPVEVKLPDATKPSLPGDSIVQDHKIDVAPAIAYLDSSGRPDVVVRSQYTEVPGAGLQPGGISHVFAYHADGTPVAGWPIANNSTVIYYGSAQEFLTEGVNAPVTASVAGGGQDEVAAQAGIFSPALLYRGDGSTAGALSPTPGLSDFLNPGGPNPDVPVGFTTTGAFGKIGSGPLAYSQPMVGAASTAHALLLPGSGTPIHNEAFASVAATGAPVSGYPATAQGLDFLSAPAIADVGGSAGTGGGDVILGGDSSALQAYDGSGRMVSGFPKFTSGWILWGPSVGDLMGDGHNEVVALTREGYVYAWRTDGVPGAGDQWWSYRHDEHNTGRWGTDTRPPGAARLASLSADGRVLSFVAPGSDWYDGTASSYRITVRVTSSPAPARGRARPRCRVVRRHGRRVRVCPRARRRSSKRAAAAARHARRRRRRKPAARRPTPHTVTRTIVLTRTPSGPAGTIETIDLPVAATSVTVQALDSSGNVAVPVTVARGQGHTPAKKARPRTRCRVVRRHGRRVRVCPRAKRRPGRRH